VAGVRRVFATLRPAGRDAEGMADFRRGAVGDDFRAELFADFAGLARRTLAAARTGRRAFQDGIDQRAADGFVRDLVRRQIELQESSSSI
jgi:hypothetical protein